MLWKKKPSSAASAAGGNTTQRNTLRRAQLDISSRYPAIGAYQSTPPMASTSATVCDLNHASSVRSGSAAPMAVPWKRAHTMNTMSSCITAASTSAPSGTTTSATASFDNTVGALEGSFQELSRISSVFYALNSAHTNDALEALALEISPLLARHYSEIFQHEGLYRRIATLQAERDRLGLNAEQGRVLERYHTAFLRAGAALAPDARRRLAEINERLALTGTRFSQNVLADEKSYSLVLEGEEDLAGLPDFVRQAAHAAAEQRGLSGKHVITLSRSSIEPFLQFSSRRTSADR